MQNMHAKSNLARRSALILGVLCLLLLGLVVGASLDEPRPGQADHGISMGVPQSIQNFVTNGDFENDLAGWTQVQDVSISTSTVHAGTKALMTTDPTQTRFAFVWQPLNLAYGTDEITFWVYPESATYISTFELIADWQNGTATFITRVSFLDNRISFTAVDTSASIANVLVINSWNKVAIQVNAANLTQDFYINDVLYSSLTSSSLPPIEHLLVGDLSLSAHHGTVFYDDISITGTGTILDTGTCPFQGNPVLAVEDETFADPDWVSEIITNSAAPNNPWTLNIALQFEDSGVSHYPPAGNPPPGRWVRYSYQGQNNQNATVEVATWYAQTIVPTAPVLSAIQFDFDTWGGGQRLGPMILQDGTYYRGPTFIVNRSDGWLAYSSGCLTASDFEKRGGAGPEQPDFAQPFVVGYSLTNTTGSAFDLRDHFIDNFRFWIDGNFTLGTPPPIPNRPPFAFSDVRVVDVGGTNPHMIGVLFNDVDLDGDALTITSVTEPQFGSTSIGTFPGFPFINYYEYVDDNPFGGPSTDNFQYTVSDGMFNATTGVLILFDYCVLDSDIALAKGSGVDLALIRRFRDEVMKPTEHGANLVDHYYDKTPALLKTLIIDRPDLGARAHSMVEMLQPSLRDVLDGDGSLPITQSQMDTVATFFADLSAAGNTAVQQLITDEMNRIGPLDAYVGQPVGEVLQTVLGDPVSTAIDDEAPAAPTDFVLVQNFPNPFAEETEIRYALALPTQVSLAVYDLQGRKVKTLVQGQQGSGMQTVQWDGLDDSGVFVSSGVYFVLLITPTHQQAKKIVVAR